MPPGVLRAAAVVGLLLLGGCQTSLRMSIVRAYIRFLPTMSDDVAELEARYLGRDYPSHAPPPDSLTAVCALSERTVAGRTVFTCTPPGGARKHILYTHGGSYVNPLAGFHWSIVAALVEHTGATVTIPLYPLAPEHTYADGYRVVEAVYRELLADVPASAVVLCGDSAGGGLALGQALHYREQGLPLPGRIVLLSPWVDVGLADPAADALDPGDHSLNTTALRTAGRWWAGDAELRDPRVSPLYGDLSGLPPVDIYQGTADLLLADARSLHAAISAVGGETALYETPKGFHVFMGATFTPEAQAVFEQIAADLR